MIQETFVGDKPQCGCVDCGLRVTDDDVRRAVCDYNDWKYAEMMPHVSLRDTNSCALRVVLESFAHHTRATSDGAA